ncbi:hypothetical protein ACHAXA_011577 [Cyclostephanos tholiformis]|uniref:Ubiquitin-like domain-containing protein n=1 Tax=Cyclostephanos tholiformis TaxID=382380 RepID=A0ABD3SGV3_9STRA
MDRKGKAKPESSPGRPLDPPRARKDNGSMFTSMVSPSSSSCAHKTRTYTLDDIHILRKPSYGKTPTLSNSCNHSKTPTKRSTSPSGGIPVDESAMTTTAAPTTVATIRLRVSHLGGYPPYHEIEMSPLSTLLDLKLEIEKRTLLPPAYQRLIAKRKRMDDDGMILGPTVFGDGGGDGVDGSGGGGASRSVLGMGIALVDGEKVLLMHSPLYERDRGGIEKLNEHIGEIDRIKAARVSGNMNDKTVQELIIQVCCKLDCVETSGSEALRMMRKATIKRAEGVARMSEKADKRALECISKEAKRGMDP